MLVFQRFVMMHVRMVFYDVQPGPHAHQQSGDDDRTRQWFSQPKREQRADERCKCEIRTGPSAPKVTQRNDEQCEADAEADESEQSRADGYRC